MNDIFLQYITKCAIIFILFAQICDNSRNSNHRLQDLFLHKNDDFNYNNEYTISKSYANNNNQLKQQQTKKQTFDLHHQTRDTNENEMIAGAHILERNDYTLYFDEYHFDWLDSSHWQVAKYIATNIYACTHEIANIGKRICVHSYLKSNDENIAKNIHGFQINFENVNTRKDSQQHNENNVMSAHSVNKNIYEKELEDFLAGISFDFGIDDDWSEISAIQSLSEFSAAQIKRREQLNMNLHQTYLNKYSHDYHHRRYHRESDSHRRHHRKHFRWKSKSNEDYYPSHHRHHHHRHVHHSHRHHHHHHHHGHHRQHSSEKEFRRRYKHKYERNHRKIHHWNHQKNKRLYICYILIIFIILKMYSKVRHIPHPCFGCQTLSGNEKAQQSLILGLPGISKPDNILANSFSGLGINGGIQKCQPLQKFGEICATYYKIPSPRLEIDVRLPNCKKRRHEHNSIIYKPNIVIGKIEGKVFGEILRKPPTPPPVHRTWHKFEADLTGSLKGIEHKNGVHIHKQDLLMHPIHILDEQWNTRHRRDSASERSPEYDSSVRRLSVLSSYSSLDSSSGPHLSSSSSVQQSSSSVEQSPSSKHNSIEISSIDIEINRMMMNSAPNIENNSTVHSLKHTGLGMTGFNRMEAGHISPHPKKHKKTTKNKTESAVDSILANLKSSAYQLNTDNKYEDNQIFKFNILEGNVGYSQWRANTIGWQDFKNVNDDHVLYEKGGEFSNFGNYVHYFNRFVFHNDNDWSDIIHHGQNIAYIRSVIDPYTHQRKDQHMLETYSTKCSHELPFLGFHVCLETTHDNMHVYFKQNKKNSAHVGMDNLYDDMTFDEQEFMKEYLESELLNTHLHFNDEQEWSEVYHIHNGAQKQSVIQTQTQSIIQKDNIRSSMNSMSKLMKKTNTGSIDDVKIHMFGKTYTLHGIEKCGGGTKNPKFCLFIQIGVPIDLPFGMQLDITKMCQSLFILTICLGFDPNKMQASISLQLEDLSKLKQIVKKIVSIVKMIPQKIKKFISWMKHLFKAQDDGYSDYLDYNTYDMLYMDDDNVHESLDSFYDSDEEWTISSQATHVNEWNNDLIWDDVRTDLVTEKGKRMSRKCMFIMGGRFCFCDFLSWLDSPQFHCHPHFNEKFRKKESMEVSKIFDFNIQSSAASVIDLDSVMNLYFDDDDDDSNQNQMQIYFESNDDYSLFNNEYSDIENDAEYDDWYQLYLNSLQKYSSNELLVDNGYEMDGDSEIDNGLYLVRNVADVYAIVIMFGLLLFLLIFCFCRGHKKVMGVMNNRARMDKLLKKQQKKQFVKQKYGFTPIHIPIHLDFDEEEKEDECLFVYDDEED